MNRIILIGNGFDLAHGLRTSYRDFIESYRNMRLFSLIHEDQMKSDDGLCVYEVPDSESRKRLNHVRPLAVDDRFYPFAKNCIADILKSIKTKYRSKFFEEINKAVDTYNWVDIEAVYYRWLTKIYKQNGHGYTDPNRLNEELKIMEDSLVTYLTYIQTNFIKPKLKISYIEDVIYEPLNIKDISNGNRVKAEQALVEKLEYIIKIAEQTGHCKYWETQIDSIDKNIRPYLKDVTVEYVETSMHKWMKKANKELHIENIRNNDKSIPDYFLCPDQILFLNFNYTCTADLYIPEDSEFRVNHIHGELGNDKNPIIFGYGDELDEDYKEISKLNDNDYLKNIKSIRYLETDNYRKLLSFIDSAPFQIYIMGHSCGNSDRTLLNTLFEHKNCVSIKPFYHLREDGSDNYIEIIQNISRNFNDMRLMRDRVVNKTYCRPLVDIKK